VYFRNGDAGIESQYRAQLRQLAAKASNLRGYVIQVQGYSSAVGRNDVNQRLSAQTRERRDRRAPTEWRAATSIVVPAAMGITNQVASNKTAKGQAENRRTVVTLLQSKGIGDQ
jgi:outer membrane protein OmpA-like peptidoglycan-associated protein